MLMSSVPLAVNTIAYAVFFGLHPEKIALAVSLSTLWSIIYIPLIILLFKMIMPL